MTGALIASEIRDGVGYLRLTRADRRNALNHALVDEALAAMDAFTATGVQVAVLEGDPPVFCAGNDLVEARANRDDPAADRFIAALLDRPLLWIAKIGGPALGAGVAVAACCPVTVAAEDAYFSLPEREVGLFPAGVVPYLEPFMGPRAAFTAGLTGDRISAADARPLGLVDEVVPAGGLDAAVGRWVAVAVSRPEVAAAGRDAWQRRFRTAAATDRAGQLAEVLAYQDFATDQNGTAGP